MKSASAVLAPTEKLASFKRKKRTHMCQEAKVLKTASQALHTAAAMRFGRNTALSQIALRYASGNFA